MPCNSFWRDFLVNVVAQNGRETTSLFTDGIWWRSIFLSWKSRKTFWGKIWRRKVEKGKSRFPSEVQENTVPQRRARQPLRVNGLVDRSGICQEVTGSSRRTLLTSEGREGKSACSAQTSRQTCKRKPLGRERRLSSVRERASAKCAQETARRSSGWEPEENEHCWSRARTNWKLSKPGRTVQHKNQPTAGDGGSGQPSLVLAESNIYTTADGLLTLKILVLITKTGLRNGRQPSIAWRKTCVLPDREDYNLLAPGQVQAVAGNCVDYSVLITTRILEAPQQNYKAKELLIARWIYRKHGQREWHANLGCISKRGCRWVCTPIIYTVQIDFMLFTSACKNPLQIVCRRFGKWWQNELTVVVVVT